MHERRWAPPERAGEPTEGADDARIELEPRRIGGLKMLDSHGVIVALLAPRKALRVWS